MTLVLPRAYQSCLPSHLCPLGQSPEQNRTHQYKQWACLHTYRLDLLMKDPPFIVVRLRMLQGFFICHPQFTKRLPDALLCHLKTCGTLTLIGIGILAHIFSQLLKVNLAELSFVRTQLKASRLTFKAGNTNFKSGCSGRKTHPFPFTDSQNMATKSIE